MQQGIDGTRTPKPPSFDLDPGVLDYTGVFLVLPFDLRTKFLAAAADDFEALGNEVAADAGRLERGRHHRLQLRHRLLRRVRRGDHAEKRRGLEILVAGL